MFPRAVFRYIEGWYNPRRRHSALGYLSPLDFEAKHRAAEMAAALDGTGRRAQATLAGTADLRHRAFVSTTCEPSRFPPGIITANVQLDACASNPIYLSMVVLLLGCVAPTRRHRVLKTGFAPRRFVPPGELPSTVPALLLLHPDLPPDESGGGAR